MRGSILNIRLSVKPPFVLATIPLLVNHNGLPFIYNTTIKADRWYLVEGGTGIEMPLDTGFLLFDGKQMYYNADLDLIAIVRGLGYNPSCSNYYYKYGFSGSVRYSKVFKMNVNVTITPPPPPVNRSHSAAFSPSFS